MIGADSSLVKISALVFKKSVISNSSSLSS
jgi:hypothetical protein